MRQNKNNRPINLPNVITFSTDFKYTVKNGVLWYTLASYPGPYIRARCALGDLVQVVRACVEFYWNPGKIVFFGIF